MPWGVSGSNISLLFRSRCILEAGCGGESGDSTCRLHVARPNHNPKKHDNVHLMFQMVLAQVRVQDAHPIEAIAASFSTGGGCRAAAPGAQLRHAKSPQCAIALPESHPRALFHRRLLSPRRTAPSSLSAAVPHTQYQCKVAIPSTPQRPELVQLNVPAHDSRH